MFRWHVIFFNVFPEELSGLPPHREIEFCINVVSDTAPMTHLTQKNGKFVWSDACENSFQFLKEKLTTAPVLILPNGEDKITVYCDASRVRLGCVLMQNGRVVAYASR